MRSVLDAWVADTIGLAQPLTREGLQRHQLASVNQLLQYSCRHSRFYQGLPAGINDLAQLAELPLITAQQLQEQGAAMICVSQSEISRIITLETSGTTDRAKRLYFTAEDQQLTVDFFASGLSQLVTAGDRMLILMPCEKVGSVGTLIAQALTGLAVTPVLGGVTLSFAQMLERIEQYRVNTLVGMPGQILALARYMNQFAIKSKFKAILLSGDYCPETVPKTLAQLLDCEVYSHYGSTESGLGGAVECGAHLGMHIRENDLLMEVIDPQIGAVMPDGQWGELVLTTLTRQGMPLIRYRTGDRGRILAKPCPCGSVLKRMDRVQGRLWPEDNIPVTLGDLDDVFSGVSGIIDYRASYQDAGQTIGLQLLAVEPSQQLQQTLERICYDHWPQVTFAMSWLAFERQGASPCYQGKRRMIKEGDQ